MNQFYLFIEDAAKVVGISRAKAYDLVKSGEWFTVSFGKRHRRVSQAFLASRYGRLDLSALAGSGKTRVYRR